jgi:hypothetical protein
MNQNNTNTSLSASLRGIAPPSPAPQCATSPRSAVNGRIFKTPGQKKDKVRSAGRAAATNG